MNRDRRHFLKMVGGGFGAAGMASMMERLTLATARAEETTPGTDYKALVCIFLNGGNDCNNFIIPINTSNPLITYNAYSSVRNGNGLALSQSTLNNTQFTVPNFGTSTATFAFHNRLLTGTPANDLFPLWGQGKLAVVTNVGTLNQYLTRDQYQHGGAKPYQLFSHSDQQEIWQTTVADRRVVNGWGGRIADTLTAQPPNDPALPMCISPAGYPLYIAGGTVTPLVIANNTSLNMILVRAGFTDGDATTRKAAYDNFLTIDRGNNLVNALAEITLQSNAISDTLNRPDPTFNAFFPNTNLAQQLRQVARIIKVVQDTPSLRVHRQVFFCSQGGYDTHGTEINDQGNRLQELSQAMRYFYQTTIEMGIANNVTSFTMSDFGRTLQPTGNGVNSVGSDHGWGSHHLVMGGAVRGGNFYGRRRDAADSTSIFPNLALNGLSDTDSRGRWIPTVAVEQYAATLAAWFGLAAGDMNYVFPNLSRFAPANLGFV